MPSKCCGQLLAAVFQDDLAAATRALIAGASVDERDRDQRTPLMHAAIEGRFHLSRLLLDHGADVNALDMNGECALHFAAREYQPAVVSLLLTAGAVVDTKDGDGNTPLSHAVFESRGRGDVIDLLLDGGASKSLKNRNGVSPLELAESIGNYDVCQFMRRRSPPRRGDRPA